MNLPSYQFEKAWAARPWVSDESAKDAAWRWWQAALDSAAQNASPSRATTGEVEVLREALTDLLSWFPEKPIHEWRLVAGEQGADDAIAAAKAALTDAATALQPSAGGEVDPDAAMEAALARFTEYFVRNYPGPDTIIHDPKWHAPKIFFAAQRALSSLASPAQPSGFVLVPKELVDEASRHMTKWLDLNDCECESGHQCGRTEVERTRDQLRALTAPIRQEG